MAERVTIGVPPRLALGAENGGGGNRTRVTSPHEPCSEAVFFAPAQGNAAQRKMRAALERTLDERDGPRCCFYCGESLDGFRVRSAIDHVVASRRGGSDSVDNLVWACRACNLLKGDAPGWFFVFWMAARARLPLEDAA